MTEDIHEAVRHWQNLQSILRGYREAQVLISATRLGVFRHLDGGPLDATELARRAGADPDGMRRLLAAAVAMGLLQEEEDEYANAPIVRACLAHEGRFYIGNLVAREDAFYRRWSHLTDAVRRGKPPPAGLRDEKEDAWVRDFELALLDLARISAPAIAEVLPLPAEGLARVLDVGGGHGGFSMALARRHPHVQATVFELSAAAEVARDLIAAEGMSERVTVETGDFREEELGRNYDLIMLFGVLGSESSEGKLALLRKTYAALTPGGAVAIRGFAYEEHPDVLEDALFSLHLLLSTSAGDSPTLQELLQALRETGFEQPEVIPLPEWIGSRLLVARKPRS